MSSMLQVLLDINCNQDVYDYSNRTITGGVHITDNATGERDCGQIRTVSGGSTRTNTSIVNGTTITKNVNDGTVIDRTYDHHLVGWNAKPDGKTACGNGWGELACLNVMVLMI